jgi:hypothetical protein
MLLVHIRSEHSMRNTALRFCLIALFFAAILTGAEKTVFAWEADVHYGLTYWLARKAGFSPEQAQLIAQGDLAADQGNYHPAPWAVALHVILGGDPAASEAVRDLHFPSFAALPAPPDQRKVEPNSSAARRLALKEVAAVDPTIPERVVLEEFGKSLHPLQDSWSHQGVPDIPFRPGWQVRPWLSWGHPKDRGGWWSHDADITCRHDPLETLGVAKATFELMLEFRSTHKIQVSQTPSRWPDLVPRVKEFAQACSKQAKLQWFESEAPEHGGWSLVLKPISVPGRLDGGQHFPRSPKELPVYRGDKAVPRQTVDNFLSRWLVARDIPAALQLVSIRDLANQLSALENAPIREEEALLWAQRFLMLWLIEDHGLANQLGHGMPATDGYVRLPNSIQELPDEFRLLRYERLKDAIEIPSGPSVEDTDPFSIVEVSRDFLRRETQDLRLDELPTPLYSVVFSFEEFPHDTLVLLIARKDNGGSYEGADWRIVRMYWVVL